MTAKKETKKARFVLEIADVNGNRRAYVEGATKEAAEALALAECEKQDTYRPALSPHRYS